MQPARDVKRAARDNPMSEWPRPQGGRPRDLVEGALAAPTVEPSFRLTPGERVFTLGSCFTRAMEDHLAPLGFDVPCHGFAVPEIERNGPRPNSVLNQYVPSVMLQELRRALADSPEENAAQCLVPVGDDQVVDMQLLASPPVTSGRGAARRHEVETLFRQAFDSDVAIMTLGQTEAWWDDDSALFCNQMPTGAVLDAHPDRFFFRPMTMDDVVAAVSETCVLLLGGRVDRIILTVSPVPISRAWGQRDALTAYVFSKSLLRVAAERVAADFAAVDYFPSYDIVALSDRSLVFSSDRMHVREPVVAAIVGRMVDAYVG